MAEKLQIELPAYGWKQFLTSRTEMLNAFDRARDKSSVHEVATYHGRVAEAEFRKWLGSFLPKRYLRGEGVSSDASGKLSLIKSETPTGSTIGTKKASLLKEFARTKTIEVTEKIHLGAMLTWAGANFSQFAFDLIALMQGTYELGRLSSFYGLGGSEFG